MTGSRAKSALHHRGPAPSRLKGTVKRRVLAEPSLRAGSGAEADGQVATTTIVCAMERLSGSAQRRDWTVTRLPSSFHRRCILPFPLRCHIPKSRPQKERDGRNGGCSTLQETRHDEHYEGLT